MNDHSIIFGSTALTNAAESGSIETVRILLDHGAGVNEKDHRKCTALCYAVKAGNADMVALLLDHGAHFNLGFGYTAFAMADEEDFWRRVSFKKRGFSIEMVTGTPLLLAARDGHVSIARMLIQKGALVNIKDSQGITALMWAAARGNVELLQLLLDSGADPAATDLNGKTALIHAQHNKQEEAVKRLEAALLKGQ